MTQRRFSASLLGLILSLTACSRPANIEAPETHAYRLIDAHRDDEAITYMEKLTNEQPANDKYRIALASAYAHKAGVRIQILWPLVNAAKSAAKLTATFGAPPPESATPEQKVDSFVNRLSIMIVHVAQLLQMYALIPNIANENLPYLEQAIYLMNQVDAIKEGDALYRALLKILQLKSNLANDLIADGSTPIVNASHCDVDAIKLGGFAKKYAATLSDILQDIAISEPPQAAELTAKGDMLKTLAGQLTTELTSVTLKGIAMNAILKQKMIEQNFGKILKCEGAPAANP